MAEREVLPEPCQLPLEMGACWRGPEAGPCTYPRTRSWGHTAGSPAGFAGPQGWVTSLAAGNFAQNGREGRESSVTAN